MVGRLRYLGGNGNFVVAGRASGGTLQAELRGELLTH